MSAAADDRATGTLPRRREGSATPADAAHPLPEVRRVRITPATADACRRHYPAFGWEVQEGASTRRHLVLSRPAAFSSRDRLDVLERDLDDEIGRMRRLTRRSRVLTRVAGAIMFLVGLAVLALAAPAFVGRDQSTFLLALGVGTALCVIPPMFSSLVRERIDDGTRAALQLAHERAGHLRVLAEQSLRRPARVTS